MIKGINYIYLAIIFTINNMNSDESTVSNFDASTSKVFGPRQSCPLMTDEPLVVHSLGWSSPFVSVKSVPVLWPQSIEELAGEHVHVSPTAEWQLDMQQTLDATESERQSESRQSYANQIRLLCGAHHSEDLLERTMHNVVH